MNRILVFFVIILGSIFCIASCNSTEKISTGFNDNVSALDILNFSNYQKLMQDEEYRDIMIDWWESELALHDVMYHATGLAGMANIFENEKEGLQAKTGYVTEGLGSIGSLFVSGLPQLKREYSKKKLIASFSKEKTELAKNFEKELRAIIGKSSINHNNLKVKDKDLLLNYKSFRGIIKQDSDLNSQLVELTDNVDDLFAMGFELRTKLNINLKLNPDLKYDYLLRTAQQIVNSNDYELNTDSNTVNKYFKQLKLVVDQTNKLKSQEYKTPIEDWSDEKRENFEFIFNDISVKLLQETNAY